MSPSSDIPTPQGSWSVSGAPTLPAVFADTFTSRYVDTGLGHDRIALAGHRQLFDGFDPIKVARMTEADIESPPTE